MMKSSQNYYPERWLKNLFNELQSIFASFEGSMLISMVVGLIDEETGMMYYFNAEHPWNILFKNKKAEFIENKIYNRKIGVINFDKRVIIRKLKLQPKDTIIIGSDGRDDIVIGYNNKTGKRIINEDEKMFLKLVEEANGNLDNIVKILKEKGEITDDLSLLRIHYINNNNYQKIPEDFTKHKSLGVKAYNNKDYSLAATHLFTALNYYNEEETYKILASTYKKIKDYHSEAEVLENALYHFPGNLDFVYKAAICYKKIKDYNRVLDFAERYNIYYPEDEKNLILLANTHYLLDNKKRARDIIFQLENINPKNKYLEKIKTLLNS